MPVSPFTSLEFRQALSTFATGVTVITVERAAGEVHGMTANSFTSVSLNPPLVSVCVDVRARLLPLLKERQQFGISILRDDQRLLSEFFAGVEQKASDEARLGVRFHWTETGVPLLDGVLAQFVCSVYSTHLAGDHTIVVGEVESAQFTEGKPLLFFRGRYFGL